MTLPSSILLLNHERRDDEKKAGLHEKGVQKKSAVKVKKKAKPKSNDGQMGLL